MHNVETEVSAPVQLKCEGEYSLPSTSVLQMVVASTKKGIEIILGV